jgi:hypothetical protein
MRELGTKFVPPVAVSVEGEPGGAPPPPPILVAALDLHWVFTPPVDSANLLWPVPDLRPHREHLRAKAGVGAAADADDWRAPVAYRALLVACHALLRGDYV